MARVQSAPPLSGKFIATAEAAQRHAAVGIEAIAAPLRAQIDERFATGLGGRRKSMLQEELEVG